MDDVKRLGKEDNIIANFESIIERLNRDGKILGEYDKEKEDIKVHNTLIENATKEGLEKGKSEGIKETAINLLKNNIDKSIIARVTGLSIEEINCL